MLYFLIYQVQALTAYMKEKPGMIFVYRWLCCRSWKVAKLCGARSDRIQGKKSINFQKVYLKSKIL